MDRTTATVTAVQPHKISQTQPQFTVCTEPLPQSLVYQYRKTFLRMFLPCFYRSHFRSLSFLNNGGDFDVIGGTHTETCSFRERMSFRRGKTSSNSLKVETQRLNASFRLNKADERWQSRRHSSFCQGYKDSPTIFEHSSSSGSKRFTFDPDPLRIDPPTTLTIPDITVNQPVSPSTENTSFASPLAAADDVMEASPRSTLLLDAAALKHTNEVTGLNSTNR